MKLSDSPYEMLILSTKYLEVPRSTYQRKLNPARVKRIAGKFDERIANDPKVSSRNGHYYVFDGQHTIAARKVLNRDRDLLIQCKVYYGLTESDEALLFAEQTGDSSGLTPGVRLRALIFSGDPEAMAFMRATESTGFQIDYDQQAGDKRIGCVSTALNQFRKIGDEHYTEGLQVIMDAWDGIPDSVRAGTLAGIMQFVDLYHDEYDPRRLLTKLRRVDPIVIYRNGMANNTFSGYKKYLLQVLSIYNGSGKNYSLPVKF